MAQVGASSHRSSHLGWRATAAAALLLGLVTVVVPDGGTARAATPRLPMDCNSAQMVTFGTDQAHSNMRINLNDPDYGSVWQGVDGSEIRQNQIDYVKAADNVMQVQLAGDNGCTYTGSINNDGVFTLNNANVAAGTYTLSTINKSGEDAKTSGPYTPNLPGSCETNPPSTVPPAPNGRPACATVQFATSANNGYNNVPCNIDAFHDGAQPNGDTNVRTSDGVTTLTVGQNTTTFSGVQSCSGLNSVPVQARVRSYLDSSTPIDSSVTSTASTPELSPTELVATGFIVTPLLYALRRRRQRRSDT